MVVCPSCGQENPAGFRFCGGCGAPLEPGAGGSREERKIVTVLFCDIVGFTSRAEELDPEDVRALLAPYHERLRSELERYGGTVEKFIGDAVMALFGAPVTHEDDPERAVRAALAIRAWAAEQDKFEVRIGVNTGEALVSLGARPEEGEGMAAGDVVNTAARLQAAAPLNGILVGEQTFRSTRETIEYEEAVSVEAKGKAEPIPAWEASQALASSGLEVADAAQTPLVGRRRELELIRAALVGVREERSPQLVTLVGVPGMGKSRLLGEIRSEFERESGEMTWRQGRSLPYGEGVTFWALGEVAKAEAGILESDADDEAAGKLARAVRELLPEGDASWVEAHLRRLVGSEGGLELAGGGREEAFAAWRRFLESMAERRTTVVAFEDLHWADEGLLDFVDYLVEWTSGVPLFVVCTARPELLTRRPHWGGGKTNTLTLALAPLSDEDTTHLVHALLERSALPVETQRALVERAGGNPLYAEEFARLVVEQGWAADAVQGLPETVQGIIAARLDLLAQEEKRLLQDASVVGEVFWLGAICDISGVERAGAGQSLHALERKEFVRRQRHSSVEGEEEYEFGHVLVRDVAYGQIPRADRAGRHRLTGEWIEGLGRPDDHAEMLAHHYVTALELNQAAGKDDPELIERARPAVSRAGDRAASLAAFEAAARFYGLAVQFATADDPARPSLLLKRGRALRDSEGTGLELIAEALAAFRAAGNDEGAAEAASAAAHLLWSRGERDEAYAYLGEALELVSRLSPTAAKTNVLLQRSAFHLVTAEFPDALRLAREALPIAEQLGLAARRARALNLIGWGRIGTGDVGGLADLETAVQIATTEDIFEHVHSCFENLRSAQFALGLLREASETVAGATRMVERFTRWERRWVDVLRAGQDFRLGSWDRAVELADEFISAAETDAHYLEPPCRTLRASMRLACGDLAGATSDTKLALAAAEVGKDDQVFAHALSARAIVAHVEGKPEEANDVASRLFELGPLVFPLTFGWPTFADVAWLLCDLQRQTDLVRSIDAIPVPTRWSDAARAIDEGDLVRAAETLAAMEHRPAEADARLRAAEALMREGRRAEADAQLGRALAFYRSVGATAYVRRGEALLAASA
jgi:class 3 adenylate cyclase/tetratricopeptide (TPR) repeat protein